MTITYVKGSLVKLEARDISLVISVLPDEGAKKKGGKFGADIALFPTIKKGDGHEDLYEYGSKKPIIINGPGEYEIQGIYIRGAHVDTKKDGSINTAYSVLFDGVNVVHMGEQEHAQIVESAKEAFGTVDVLLLPIHDENFSAESAHKIATALDPKVIVPLYDNGTASGKKLLSQFLKEEGIETAPKEIAKLSVKKKELEGRQGDVLILESTYK